MRLYRARRRARIRWMSLIAIAGAAAAWHFGWLPAGALKPITDRFRGTHQASQGDDAVSPAVSSDATANGASRGDDVVFVAQTEPPVDDSTSAGPDRAEPSSLTPSRRIAALQWDDPPTPTMAQNIAVVAESPAQRPSTDTAPRPLPDVEPATDEIRPNRTAVASTPAKPAVGFLELAEIDRMIEAGKDLEAHRALSRIYWERPTSRPQIQERIDASARRIFFSPQPHVAEPYVVQPDEQLRVIARKYHVPWQYLSKLNRADPRKIRPGQKLKVLRGPFSAFIDLSDFELTLHAHGYYVRRYPVGIGKDGSTPVGKFTVQTKLEDPTYYGPEGVVIAHDDPNNPLGERWIDIGDSYGIHGTVDVESIGKAVSRGCIRMRNEDVEEVYDMLDVGSDVVIRR